MGLSLLDRCLKLTINMQIRVGITFVVLMAIIISILLLTMSNLIQYHNFTNYYENIIQDEDNKMLLNYEQYIHTIESTVERKAKSDLEFYRVLETMYFENLEGLELSTLLDTNYESNNIIHEFNEENITEKCYDKDYLKCIAYQFNKSEEYKDNEDFQKILSYYNLISPLLNSSLSENCVGIFNLRQYHNFQFYKKFYSNDKYIGDILFFAGTNKTLINESYNEENYQNTIASNIFDNLLNIFLVIPSFNKKLDIKYILNNLNTEFLSVPQITSKYISENDENIPYIINQNKELVKFKQNNLYFESKIFNFNNIDIDPILYFVNLLKENNSIEAYNETINNITQIFLENMRDLIVIKWSDSFFENLVNDIFEKYKKVLNIFSLLYSPYASIKENINSNLNYFFDDKNGIFLTQNILEKFACIYLIKKELAKTETDFERLNSFNIKTCSIKFDEDFEEYLQNNKTEIDIYERKKIKVGFTKYDIEYIYYYFEDGNEKNESKKISFDLSKSKDKENDKIKNSFKIFQGIYPSNFINLFSSFLYNNFIFVNFYFTDLFSNYRNMESIRDVCYTYFFQIILISSAILWVIILLIIIIIVLKISHSISDPIDKLIQPVPMNDNSSRELNKYFKNISYTDDSTINELFVLCKKLIIGGFKSEEDYKQKKKNKMINSYNNISLVKTNNMIINEDEIMKGVKKQEINFFEKQNVNQNYFGRLIKKSVDKVKRLNYKVLSGHLFTGKFYQNNKRNLIKDKEYYDLLNNEMISQKKKNFDDNKSKGMKFSIIPNLKNSSNINNTNS